MEQFEAIRRDHAREGLSICELARRHGVHRRAVWQALESAVPPLKRAPQDRSARALGAYHRIIDEWLKADREAPRKQRHTAKRIWQRLRDEHGAEVSERQVVGLRVTATIAASAITIRHDGKVVAVHERLSGRHGVSAQLDHYLELLAVKPGALGQPAGRARQSPIR